MTEAKDFTQEIKDRAEKATELAKNIWLAGLGAYGKAIDEAQGQFEKASEKVTQESNRLFEELVAKGKQLEGDTQAKLAEVKEKSSASLEERLAQVKESFSFSTKSDDLAEKVDALSEKLDLIIASLGKDAKPAATKAAAPKKAAATKKAAASTAEKKEEK